MPAYTYTCPKCKKVFDSFSTIAKRNEPQECECGALAARDIAEECKNRNPVDATMAEHPRWSWAMACDPRDIPKMMKLFPGSEYRPDTGQLRIKGRKHKLFEMKRRGFEEY